MAGKREKFELPLNTESKAEGLGQVGGKSRRGYTSHGRNGLFVCVSLRPLGRHKTPEVTRKRNGDSPTAIRKIIVESAWYFAWTYEFGRQAHQNAVSDLLGKVYKLKMRSA